MYVTIFLGLTQFLRVVYSPEEERLQFRVGEETVSVNDMTPAQVLQLADDLVTLVTRPVPDELGVAAEG